MEPPAAVVQAERPVAAWAVAEVLAVVAEVLAVVADWAVAEVLVAGGDRMVERCRRAQSIHAKVSHADYVAAREE
ncbi:MAG TPA: hypothetical protein VF746_05190 [Longimicrobium sp.]